MTSKKKVHIKVKSENLLLQTSFCLLSLLQRNKKKTDDATEWICIFTKKEKKKELRDFLKEVLF